MSSDARHAGEWPRLRGEPLVERLADLARRRRWLLLLVVAPTALFALYMYVLAANQYVSDSSVLVRSQATQTSSILGQVLSGSSFQPASEEAAGVVDYLQSHDAARRLRKEVDLVSIWRRNGLDVFAGMKADPTDEDLTRELKKRVSATLNTSTGIVSISVRSFRPEDSKLVADKLLSYSEELVNRFSERAEADALRVSQNEVQRAAQRVSQMTEQVTRFRDARQSLDPGKSAAVVTEVMGGLEGQLARSRAELAALRTYLKPGTPRLVEQETRVAALETQVSAQKARLTGGEGSLAPTVAGYERLTIDRELATRAYASALTSLEAARLDAQKQHVYLVRVVEPNLPQKSTYPKRGLNTLSLLGALLLAYGIGWLVIQGVREHAA